MPDTLGSLSAEVIDWLRGTKVTSTIVNSAINDAIDTEFKALIRASLSVLMGGPVNLSIAAAAERTTIVSITDPVAATVITNVVSGALAQHTVIAAYTLVTDSGTETLISPTATAVIPVNDVASVTSPSWVNGAIGWNCYCADTTGRLAKQNQEPLEFGTPFIEDDSGIVDNPDFPSPPNENTTGDNIFYIRHMEVLTTAGVLKPWNNADIDSDLMRRAAMTLSSSSEFQSYAYDLINQRQLEVRPAIGDAITARYFYIVKPRRLMFANSPLPFPTVPSVKFLRCQALSDIFLSVRETSISNSWQKKADIELASCVLAVTSMNRPKNQRITPFRT